MFFDLVANILNICFNNCVSVNFLQNKLRQRAFLRKITCINMKAGVQKLNNSKRSYTFALRNVKDHC